MAKPKVEWRVAVRRWGKVKYYPKKNLAAARKAVDEYEKPDRLLRGAPEAWVEAREVSKWERVNGGYQGAML